MGDIIIVLLVFWVIGKLLKGVFGGFSKMHSDLIRFPPYQRVTA